MRNTQLKQGDMIWCLRTVVGITLVGVAGRILYPEHRFINISFHNIITSSGEREQQGPPARNLAKFRITQREKRPVSL